jgi:uncharacterized protein (DUF362 family)/NAD-dependent dihydropyrimidine dehydrogenase PreA subunit
MSKVVVQECGDYDIELMMGKINSGIEILGGWEKFIHTGMTILIKVNLIGPKPAESAAVTHCEFVRALTRILIGRGCKVWIGDSSGGAIAGIAPTAGSLEVSGLGRVAREEGAEIKNFDREGAVKVDKRDDVLGDMYLAKPLFDADFIINAPKLKTHSSGIYTGAVKNLFGCVPGLRKAAYHKAAPNPKNFGQVLADINEAVAPGLHIMDGIMAMEGEGPTAGEAYPAKKIIISTDPLALNTAAMKMIGLDVADLPIYDAARERKLGEYNLKNIEVLGDYDSPPKLTGFKLPKSFGSTKKQNYGFLVKIIDFLKAKPRIDRKICKNCNMCVESCPVQAINKQSKVINYKVCIECMCCHELCMQKAVKLKNDNPVAGVVIKLFGGKYK